MAYKRAIVEERDHGRMVGFKGDRALVVLSQGDGSVRALPAAPFRKAGLGQSDWFVLVVRRVPGGRPVGDPEIRKVAPPRAPTRRRATPAVYVRRGRSVTTRR